MKRPVCLVLALAALGPTIAPIPAEAVIIRIGTVAPQRSLWMQYLWRLMKEVRKATDGRVRLWLYPDGRKGSEVEMVDLMKKGDLQGAALTGVGLGRINPAFLVQQLPMLFRSHRELDCLRAKMDRRFGALLADKGFVALGYGDVGFVRLFTKNRVTTSEQLAKVKMWSWAADPISRKMLGLAGLQEVPLAVAKVRKFLETGDLNGFYASPYAAIALGWFPHARYMLATRLAMAVGAIVVTRSAWRRVTRRDRKVVRRLFRRWTRRLNRRIRRQNARALRVLLRKQVTPVRLRAGEHSIWVNIAEKTQAHFTDKLYPAALLAEVRTTIRSCRRRKNKSRSRAR